MFSCQSVKTTTDYDRTVDFSKYKTFAFTKEATELPTNEIIRRRILTALVRAMAAKGFTEATQNPDVLPDLNVKLEKNSKPQPVL